MANKLNWRGEVEFGTGDTIRVHQTIIEGSKTRTQIFEGIVIRIKGHAGLKSFTVRKIAANNVGVERIFPEDTPTVIKVDIKKRGKVRRAVLNYLKTRIGRRATKIKDVFVKGAGKMDSEPTEVLIKGEMEAPVEGEERVIKNKIGKDANMEAKKAARKERQSKKKKKVEKKEKVFVR